MNFKLTISTALLISASAFGVISQTGQEPSVTGVVTGQSTAAQGLSAANTKVGGMQYNDITDKVELEAPFKFLNVKVMSFQNNPTTGQLSLNVPFERTTERRTTTESNDSDSILVGTIKGSTVGSTSDFYIYVKRGDVKNLLKAGGLTSGLKGIYDRVRQTMGGGPVVAQEGSTTTEPTESRTIGSLVQRAKELGSSILGGEPVAYK